jgi:hypothetical protein
MPAEAQAGEPGKPKLVECPPRGESFVEYKKYWAGIEASEIVDWSIDYVVFFDKRGEVDWDTSAKYDEKISANAEGLAQQNAILAEAAILEAKNCDAFGQDVKDWFRYLLGKALVFSFEGDYAGAQKTLLAAGQYFRARSEEKSRWWYLTGSITFTLPFIAMGTWIWFLRAHSVVFLGETVFWLALCLVAGAFGALLSVIARSGKLDFDSSAGLRLHYLEAASRIVMGALSGTVIGLAVKSHLFLEPLMKDLSTKNAIIILAAFAAGASERMLGSIISKFDPNVSSEKPNAPSEKPDALSEKKAQ